MSLSLPRRTGAPLVAALLCLACGSPTSPDVTMLVRLGLSPPAIQATPDGPGWRASWTVNLDAEREYPADTHGVLLEIASPPASVILVHAEVHAADGTLLAMATTSASAIDAGTAGSTTLVAGGPLIQVTQEVLYVTSARPPSQSTLTVVVTLRDARGLEHRVASTSLVGEALCGGRGLPPCESAS